MAKKTSKVNKANNTNKISNNKENNKKSFWKDFKAELKRVSWPTPKQLVNNTVAVITIVLITAVIVFVLDLAFEALNKNGINQIKSVIGNNITAENNNTSAEENTNPGNSTEVTEKTNSSEEQGQTETVVEQEQTNTEQPNENSGNN